MAITRRQFITRTGLAAAGTLIGPGLFRNPLLREAFAQLMQDRYLIVLFLDGGNDGLNTVTPQAGPLRSDYEDARNSIQLLPGELIVPVKAFTDTHSGTQLGFHPGLGGTNGGIAALYDANMVAVIQGCGYPEYNLSHDLSRSIWQTGSPLTTVGTGWMGRYLLNNGYAPTDIPACTIGDSVAPELRQTATSVLAFDNLQDFGFPYDYAYDNDTTFKDAVFNALHRLPNGAAANANSTMQYIGNTGGSTLDATNSYPPLHRKYVQDRPTWNAKYSSGGTPPGLNTSTARDFREIAKVIYGVASGVANVNARFFELRNGGYDTHSDQGGADSQGQHYNLHREVGDAVKLFFDDLTDMAAHAGSQTGLQNLHKKVVVMVWSEFARRITQNDSGTDHGSQGPMFVIGGGVNGGVYGTHANIAQSALDDDGNTPYSQAPGFRSTDFRDVYGTIIKHWLGMADPSILLPTDPIISSSYWNTANFDMGFV